MIVKKVDLGFQTTFAFFLLSLWWIWLPIFLYAAFLLIWLYYARYKYWRSLKWVLLEIRPPKEIIGSPKPMEQIFDGLWPTLGTVFIQEQKYFKGEFQDHFSFEIVGINGKIGFFVRTPAHFKNLVEAHFYSQYPDIEIVEVDDYVKNISFTLPDPDWNLIAFKFLLAQPNPYPIKTYPQFLEITGDPVKRFIDPLASLMEIFSKLREGEQVWIQIVSRPVPDRWKDEGKKVINKMLGKAEEKKRGLLEMELITWFKSFKTVIGQLFLGVAEPTIKKEEKAAVNLSGGEQEALKLIEQKIVKKGFESKIHFIYIARKDILDKTIPMAVTGVFTQFSILNANSFKKDFIMNTYLPAVGWRSAEKRLRKKQDFLRMASERSFWEKGYILNVEELATLFHFPVTEIKAPMTPRIEIKKGSPPPNLPVSS